MIVFLMVCLIDLYKVGTNKSDRTCGVECNLMKTVLGALGEEYRA